MKIFGANELLEDVFEKNLCIGCGACTYLCPYFRSYRGRTAILFPCNLTQGRCWAYCPKVEVDLDDLSKGFFGRSYEADPLGFHRSVKISKAGRQVSEGTFQAGGTVSALMSFALSKGYISAAALTDREGLRPVPRLVQSPDDILRCSSSKYTASPTLSALNQAINEGHNQIGVVGTPCQVLAIAQMRSNPMGDKDFSDPVSLVVGLFCTWAVDFREFDAFISERIEGSRITKVDIPPPPAEIMEVYTDNGKIEIPLDEIRELVPDIALRTTFMVGFPSDSEDKFRLLYDFCREMEFDHLGVFTYCQEEGTGAYRYGDPIPQELKEDFKRRLMELQASISSNKNKAMVGNVRDVLIEGRREGDSYPYWGRLSIQAPEVDGVVFISEGESHPGEFVPVRIEEGYPYDLVGRICSLAK
ncbi:hypothetical protein CEE39_09260 [bacterium (candidate division B38) B3_B38]|nr:MAG: hypothetical protein CEE39_09260 [bacterium (candidate division B38) B3_B38]